MTSYLQKPNVGTIFLLVLQSLANVDELAKLASVLAAIRGMRDDKDEAFCSNGRLTHGSFVASSS